MLRKTRYIGILVGSFSTLLSVQAQAVPSFARQTNMSCSACHLIYPELTPFGRDFKLNGYTLSSDKQIEAKDSDAASGLQLNQTPPLSAMLQVNATNSKGQEPKTEMSLPGEFSLFYAGKLSSNMGAFIQFTMEQGTGFGMDNTDIRYASKSGDVTYGVTLNNSPTVQDLWNSTPVWGYPWTGGADLRAPVVADALAQNVAGVGGYADWGNGIYTEVSMYHDTNAFDAPSEVPTNQVRVKNFAPYWRVAWNKPLSNGDDLMVGTYGMHAKLFETNPPVFFEGPADKYTDIAVDTQYVHTMANSNAISAHASYTNEKQTLDLSSPGNKPTLSSFRVDGAYHWGYHTAVTLAYAMNSGSKVGKAYDDKAWTVEADYLPWQNTKFTAQYVKYTEIDGETGSAATDNDTLLLQAWLMW